MRKKNLCLKYLIFITFPLLLSPGKEFSRQLIFTPSQNEYLHNVTIINRENGEKGFRITDNSCEYNRDRYNTDIALSFNYSSQSLKRDDTGHYKIAGADYIFQKGAGSYGRGCAQFYKADHGIEIETSKSLWLGRCQDLGSFAIEFRFQPHSLRGEGILFARSGYLSGEKKYIGIAVKEKKIISVFRNVFRRPDGTYVDLEIPSEKNLNAGQWYHFLLTYNRLSGRITAYLNGDEETTSYITENGRPYGNVYIPSFEDL